MSQAKITAYMERHRIGPLFEDLMNKVLRDMPEEPMVYLLRAMYKKGGMEIPQGIRYGGLRKSTAELGRSGSPERQVRHSQAAAAESGDVAASRDYDRPWTSNARRVKPKKPEAATGVIGSEHQSVKPQPEWNADKTKSSTFDQLWADSEGAKRERSSVSPARKSMVKKSASSANAWASVGLQEEEQFTGPEFKGRGVSQHGSRVTEAELLAAESIQQSGRGDRVEESSVVANSRGRGGGPRSDSHAQRERLSHLLVEADRKSDDSGIDDDGGCLGHDKDAIELLENAEDLRREGVVNVPKSGYKLSKAVRYRANEPRVKLQINAYPTFEEGPVDSYDDVRSVRSDACSDRQSHPYPGVRVESDEEFESVSEVTGPRHPVWKVPDSDGEQSNPLAPSFSPEIPQRGSRQTSKQAQRVSPRYSDQPRELMEDAFPSSLTPNRVSFDESNLDPLSSRREMSLQSARSEQSLQSASTGGGWRLPDTEIASGHDWNQRVKGLPPRDPKAY